MSDERDPEWDQALPTPNDQPSVHELVTADLLERATHGARKYGTPLQAFNGRNPLLDAYEEALDLTVYLKQALIEQAERIARARQGGTITHRATHDEPNVEEIELRLRPKHTLDLGGE